MSWQSFLESRGYRRDPASARLRVPARVAPPGAAACVDLGHHALLRLDGPDARTFLQGYLTCDVRKLAPDRALPGAFCNTQGRVVADGVLVEVDAMPAFWLHGSLREPLVAFLRKYLAFSKSKFLPADETTIVLGVIGTIDDSTLPEATFAAHAWHGGVAVRMPGTQARWLLLLPEEAATALWLRFEAAGGIADSTEWALHDVRARWPRVTRATSEAFLPQMLGLTGLGAVSFDKGCYLGQEIVARAEHRGQVKRHLFGVTWSGSATPAPGDVLHDDGNRTVATVVSAAPTGADRGEGLVVAAARATRASSAAGVTFDFP